MLSCADGKGDPSDRERFLTIFQPELIRRASDLLGFACEYSRQHYNHDLYSHFGIPFPISIQRSVLKRQAEYLAGRVVADHALKALPVSSSDVLIGRNREPVWPDGVVGSISHTDGIACAVLAMQNKVRAVGIDIESYISQEVLNDIENTIFDSSEISLLKTAEFKNYSIAATVAFSAKESLFKALFPFVQYYFGFDSVRLGSISKLDRTLRLELTSGLSTNEFLKGHHFQVDFQIFDRKVLTVVVIK